MPTKTSLASLALLAALLATTPAAGWPGDQHTHITATAIELLPPEDRERIAAEAAALAREYCEFPDENWACYGEWGGGEADPRRPRFPDRRREWEISFYTGWNPVTREGQGYVHRAPESYAAVPRYFRQAVEALQAGRLEDAARYLGVALHYVEDSAAFGHLQPIHRAFRWQTLADVRGDGYTPRRLGSTTDEAAAAIVARLQGLVAFTEEHTGKLTAEVDMPMAEVKRLCAGELMPAAAVAAVKRVRETQPAAWDAVVRACALECVHVSADVLHTALALAPRSLPAAQSAPLGANLAFNPSFEEPGDEVPAGWCVGWLDLADRTGRAEWYRAGRHWDKPLKSGQRSLLVLWPPEGGIEWRQTWRRAIRVTPGEHYRASAWVLTRSDAGAAQLALEFSDTAYLPLARATSARQQGDSPFQQLTLDAEVPHGARWLRLILASDASGAAWFDDVAITRRPAAGERP